jgi:hypothetical protein
MKVISIWQPFALLSVRGFKIFETRTWAMPSTLIGQRVGIASTKNVKPEQRAFVEDEEFQAHYLRTGLPPMAELPMGYLMGTVIMDSCELMTEEFVEDVSAEEQAYGFWDEGNYAWRQREPMWLKHPIPIQGKQGIYEWDGKLPDDEPEVRPFESSQARQGEDGFQELQAHEGGAPQQAAHRRGLYLVDR